MHDCRLRARPASQRVAAMRHRNENGWGTHSRIRFVWGWEGPFLYRWFWLLGGLFLYGCDHHSCRHWKNHLRISANDFWDLKFTYCFCAHMHEIAKYFILTGIQKQCLNPVPATRSGPSRPTEVLGSWSLDHDQQQPLGVLFFVIFSIGVPSQGKFDLISDFKFSSYFISDYTWKQSTHAKVGLQVSEIAAISHACNERGSSYP